MNTAISAAKPLEDGVKGLLREGKVDEALQTCDLLLQADAQNAFAHGVRGQIFQRKGDVVKAMQSYLAAVTLDPDQHDARENLGGLIQRTFPLVMPPSATDLGDDPEFIYVMGSSYARSFSLGTLYLPFMMGTSFTLSFLSPELAKASRNHIFAHLDRVDLRNPVLFAFFESNSLTHAQNKAGTKTLQTEGVLGSSEDLIIAGAHRYGEFLGAVAARYPGIKAFILNACPQLNDEQSAYVKLTNPILKQCCEEEGFLFVDIWDQLADPETEFIREELCTAPGNVHLSKDSTSFVTNFLRDHGVLPSDNGDFTWSHMIRFQIGEGEVSRVWTEPHAGPENLIFSRLVAFNAVMERAVSHLLATLPMDGSARVSVPNCREGYVPLAISPHLASTITAADPSHERIKMARRLAHFAGRDDIGWRVGDAASDVEPFDFTFVVLHDDDAIADIPEFLSALLQRCTRQMFVVSTQDWASQDVSWVQGAQASMLDLSARHLEGPWAAANLLIIRRPMQDVA